MTSPAAHTPSDAKDDKWKGGAYNKNASFVYSTKFTAGVTDLLAAQPGEHILDLGCGSGDLTLTPLLSSVLPSGSILGVDYSPALLSTAATSLSTSAFTPAERARIEWKELDGHELGSLGREGEFDAVFTNAALHWMKRDPQRVVDGAYEVLKTGGRFVGEMGGLMNMVGVRSTLHQVLAEHGVDASTVDPWFFPSPEVYTALLEKAGFKVESCDLIPRPTPLPTGLRGWLETFAFAFLDALPSPSDRETVIDEVCKRLEVDMKHEGGWTVMYVRLRFKAWKE